MDSIKQSYYPFKFTHSPIHFFANHPDINQQRHLLGWDEAEQTFGRCLRPCRSEDVQRQMSWGPRGRRNPVSSVGAFT